jgi:hypothetical protein
MAYESAVCPPMECPTSTGFWMPSVCTTSRTTSAMASMVYGNEAGLPDLP